VLYLVQLPLRLANVFSKTARLPGLCLDVGRHSGKDVKNVPLAELIETEMGDAVPIVVRVSVKVSFMPERRVANEIH